MKLSRIYLFELIKICINYTGAAKKGGVGRLVYKIWKYIIYFFSFHLYLLSFTNKIFFFTAT